MTMTTCCRWALPRHKKLILSNTSNPCDPASEEAYMRGYRLFAAFVICWVVPIVSAAGSPQTASARRSLGSTAEGGAAVALRQDMRKLWTDHVVWTRDYILAAVGDQPDAQAAAGRLMKNQEDIG